MGFEFDSKWRNASLTLTVLGKECCSVARAFRRLVLSSAAVKTKQISSNWICVIHDADDVELKEYKSKEIYDEKQTSTFSFDQKEVSKIWRLWRVTSPGLSHWSFAINLPVEQYSLLPSHKIDIMI